MTFKSYLNINEATLSGSKNPVGTEVQMGGSKISKKFIQEIKKYESVKEYDEFVVAPDSTQAIEINFSRGNDYYFIQSKKSKNIYKVQGKAGGNIDKIFKYKTGRGKGGVKFEKLFSDDLENFISAPLGSVPSDLKYPDIIVAFAKEVKKIYKINLQELAINDWEIKDEGKMNKKRNPSFNGTFSITSDGQTVTDVTLLVKGKPIYISLKMSKSMYLINMTTKPYIEDGNINTRKEFYEYFGLNGGPNGMGLFGKKYEAPTKIVSESLVKNNITNIIQKIYGGGYILVHDFTDGTYKVKYIDGVKINIKSGLSYTYPISKKNASIKFLVQIDGIDYKADIQFRDTKGGVSKPTYIRFNLVKA